MLGAERGFTAAGCPSRAQAQHGEGERVKKLLLLACSMLQLAVTDAHAVPVPTRPAPIATFNYIGNAVDETTGLYYRVRTFDAGVFDV